MGFTQDVDELAAASKAVGSNWKGYLAAYVAGAVSMLVIIGLFKLM